MTRKTPSSEVNPRREFLRQSGLLLGGVALLGTTAWSGPVLAAEQRTYSGGTFALEIDGQSVGFLKSFEGGFAKAEVISESASAGAFVKKHIGQPRYQDIVLECDPIMPKPLFD
jgi:hypothetical protein